MDVSQPENDTKVIIIIIIIGAAALWNDQTVPLPGLDGDCVLRLHEVNIGVTPGLWGSVTGSSASSSITQIITSMIRISTMIIPEEGNEAA